MNNPVNLKYEFRGFRLLKADFTKIKDGPLKSFTINSRKQIYDEKNQIFEILVDISLTFGDEVSKFLFSSGFKIIDLEWLEVMAEPTIINDLFAVVFPFIRSKIFDFTSDFRPGFLMPAFDVKQFDFTKNVNFNLEIKKQEQPKPQNTDGLIN